MGRERRSREGCKNSKSIASKCHSTREEFGIVTRSLNCVSDGSLSACSDSKCSLLSSYFPEKITLCCKESSTQDFLPCGKWTIQFISGRGLDVCQKLCDYVRHELKSTRKYYRLGGLPLALQIWIFECCSKTIAESPWQKYIEKCLFIHKIRYLYKVNTFDMTLFNSTQVTISILFCLFGFSLRT
ncbi:hypothetical protein H5410_047713 [Solanum commersonii]|uniref:Uncharacterized protein n=1 Tax=Solanum commersonii TaxID=4109 RepID=A0A9J5XI50_SOLCO|nr:hypothetical protein H5410_047713 [Solanum commersonii]